MSTDKQTGGAESSIESAQAQAEDNAGSSGIEGKLLEFAKAYKNAGTKGVPALEQEMSAWISLQTAESLVGLDTEMLGRICTNAGLDKGKAWAFRMSIDKATPQELIDEVFELRNKLAKKDSKREDPSFSIGNGAAGNQEVYEVAKGTVEATGLPVIEVDNAEARVMFGDKKTSFDTGKANHEGAEVPAISNDDVAKVQQNLENKVQKYRNLSSNKSKQNAARTLRGDTGGTERTDEGKTVVPRPVVYGLSFEGAETTQGRGQARGGRHLRQGGGHGAP